MIASIVNGVVEGDLWHVATPDCMLVVSSCRDPHYIM